MKGIRYRASTKGIDCPYSRPSKREIHQSKTPGSEKGGSNASSRFDEDCRAIEGDDVNYGIFSNQFNSSSSSSSSWRAIRSILYFPRFPLVHLYYLLPHICCPIMMIPEACVARRMRGMVNSSMKRVKMFPLLDTPDCSMRMSSCRSSAFA